MLADINGVRLAFSDSGAGSPPVVLVHGFPLNRSMWDPQLGWLRSVGRVVAPDLRGFGASEAGTAGPLTMEQHADDLAALLDHLGVREPAIFCGLSMGGYVLFRLWARHRGRVRGLVLADTKASADTPEAREGRLQMARAAAEQGSPAPAMAMLPRLLSPASQDRPIAEQVKAMIASTPAQTVADAQRGMAARQDSTDLLASIDVPVLVVVGAEDVITPSSEAQAMVERLPNARLEIIPGAGHLANLENPDAFNQALMRFVPEV